MNMYVSNLATQVTGETLRSLFSKFGEVTSAKLINDRETGLSRGFGFVEMADDAGKAAMAEINGTIVEGKPISVVIARPKTGSGSFGGNSGGRW